MAFRSQANMRIKIKINVKKKILLQKKKGFLNNRKKLDEYTVARDNPRSEYPVLVDPWIKGEVIQTLRDPFINKCDHINSIRK